MKNIILTLFFLASIHLIAQTDGISYQAVIIGPDNQELPGVDAEGNILPNATVSIRFTIIDANNGIEYQEIQTTNTDQYGRINLTIGSVNPDEFTKINWDGTSKDLKVEIDFSGAGSGFVDMSREKLTFLPYGFHRDIKATGKLEVDDITDLNSELTVGGPTRLNSTLDVNNNNTTNLTGELNVDGAAGLNNTLDVQGKTDLNDELNVNNNATSNFSGDLNVAAQGTAKFDGDAVFNGESKFKDLSVDGPAKLNGKVSINANLDGEGGQNNINTYPLLVEGSMQGIAIKVNEGRSKDNNYISFWDQSDPEDAPKMWGRIEGVTVNELTNDEGYKRGLASRNLSIFNASRLIVVTGAEQLQALAGSTSELAAFAGCAGFGACIVSPAPSKVAVKALNVVVKIANFIVLAVNLGDSIKERDFYVENSEKNIGVSYQSGAGDYAEWLPKENLSESFTAGELVGVKNGFVTKNVWGAEKVMVVSTRPIVLGNMPQPNNEKKYVKIAFMGQVPVKVIGNVAPGDYILPSEFGSGFAKAVHPQNMKTRDYKKVVGVAWSTTNKIANDVSIVNVAVGININDLSNVVAKQEDELMALKEDYSELKKTINASNSALSKLVPGYKEAIGFKDNSGFIEQKDVHVHEEEKHQGQVKDNIVYPDLDDIVYFKIEREQIETSIDLAREQYAEMLKDQQLQKVSSTNFTTTAEGIVLIPLEEHPFWQKIDSNPDYREEIIQYVESSMEKTFHTHKKYMHKFNDLKVRN
ncbi:hypothetical protein [Aquimarina mytili]|uniref:Peptidase S74 domain-containing protein n=1 Tax=Aquimarina mytili TaxID=874423 RepID=A0A936ZYK9_9FLAO|nr:hypothetical protein [Aquimarina mytili]MBL0683536.1 hypothetical protein [Aquimarina mytili]